MTSYFLITFTEGHVYLTLNLTIDFLWSYRLTSILVYKVTLYLWTFPIYTFSLLMLSFYDILTVSCFRPLTCFYTLWGKMNRKIQQSNNLFKLLWIVYVLRFVKRNNEHSFEKTESYFDDTAVFCKISISTQKMLCFT